jgi:hypothetical protein
MEWIPVTPDDLPGREVLAANFQKGTYGYKEKILGYLSANDDSVTGVSAEGESAALENVTHYVDIHKFDL